MSGILFRDNAILRQNNAIFGTGKLPYNPYVLSIFGSMISYRNGNLLGDQTYTVNSVDFAHGSTEKLAKVMKNLQTEFQQVQGIEKVFNYNKQSVSFEHKVGNLKQANLLTVQAKAVNNLLRHWDHSTYNQSFGNTGMTGSPNRLKVENVPVSDIQTLLVAINEGFTTMKEALNITDNDISSVVVGYTAGISNILRQSSLTGDTSGMQVIRSAFPNITFAEIPKDVASGNEYLELNYKPLINLHASNMPSLYAMEDRDYGTVKAMLFAFETATLELEEVGAVVKVETVISSSPLVETPTFP